MEFNIWLMQVKINRPEKNMDCYSTKKFYNSDKVGFYSATELKPLKELELIYKNKSQKL